VDSATHQPWKGLRKCRCPECIRRRLFERDVMRKHGLTPGRLAEIRKAQDNKCALCRSELTAGKRVHIDHCHRTKAIRGILCARCNTGLGKLGDDIEGIRRALEYLERFEKRFRNAAKKQRHKARKAAGLVTPRAQRQRQLKMDFG
jgi:hypothetical protein